MANLDVAAPFRDLLAFITGIAAICSLTQDEVYRKVAGANKEVFRVLWAACAPDRLEWLWSNVRLCHALPQVQLLFLPRGTSSNEASRAEINARLRTRKSLHRSTLRLKLRLMQYRKLLTHHVATCYPFARVTSESAISSRACAGSTCSVDSWNESCDEQGRGRVQKKADLPLARARDAEAALVRVLRGLGWEVGGLLRSFHLEPNGHVSSLLVLLLLLVAVRSCYRTAYMVLFRALRTQRYLVSCIL